MKIAARLGSPRPRGKSSALAHTVLKTAGELGAEVRNLPGCSQVIRGEHQFRPWEKNAFDGKQVLLPLP